MDLKELTLSVVALSRGVSTFIEAQRYKLQHHDIEEKSQYNYVTYVDKTSERMLVEELSVLLPEAGFIVEENTSQKVGARYNWIVDPLDGTTNFIHNLPPYSISIALQDGDEIVLGVVHEINSLETFYAWKDGGAWMNDKPIHVRKAQNLHQSLMVTGFPYIENGKLDRLMKLYQYLIQHSRGVRRLGSAAVDLAYVACGRFAGFYEYGLQPWDVAAGSIIVKEAGGEVTDFHNGQNFLFGKELVATNALIHDELIEKLQDFGLVE